MGKKNELWRVSSPETFLFAFPSPIMTLFGGVRFPMDRPAPRNVGRIDIGCIPMLVEMTRRGVRIDKPHLTDLSIKIHSQLDGLLNDIEFFAGQRVNTRSWKEVGKLLFKELKVQGNSEVPRTATGGESTADDVISLFISEEFPVVKMISDARTLGVLLSGFVDKLPGMVDQNDRLHTTFRNTRARTGRLSSEDPNLQNIPIIGEWGKPIRNAFIASPGHKLGAVDLGQIEMRVLAHMCRDESLIKIFRDRLDIHVMTAAEVFRIPIESVDKQLHRLPVKSVNFGVIYGETALGLMKQIASLGGPRWTLDEMEAMLRRYFQLRPGIKTYMQETETMARRFGMVWDFMGRVRLIPEAKSAVNRVLNAGIRQAVNHRIQGGAQEIIKLAMAELMPHVEYFQSFPSERCWPLLQIHDELVFELSPSIAEDFMDIARTIMENAVPLIVPIEASRSVAEKWGELK